ncbi:MAG: electron transfer flavoprotein subunit alpha/FixB family protein [Bacteroidetes bacterium]|nr:electron transfer flavoprotein subunit alpha/FixB family protein [Bacteroidota bacterium]
MSSILVVLSVQDGRIKRSSLEGLSRAVFVSKKLQWDVSVAIFHGDAPSFVEEAGQYGAKTAYCVSNPIFNSHLNTPWITGLSKVIELAKPRLVVVASTESTKDILGAVAIRSQAAVLSDVATFDVATFDVAGDIVVCERPIMAAKMMAATQSKEPLVIVSLRSGSYEAVKTTETSAEINIVAVPFDFDSGTLTATLKEIVRSTGETVDLSEAKIVVAAGRGVKDAAGKALIDELASITGAAVGASRAVVESGLFPATAQIGQTGKVVSPELYFAVGISGAIQHVAGMSNSRVIVAINKDADAPIFDVATYGLVGDCFKILPILNAELKKILS